MAQHANVAGRLAQHLEALRQGRPDARENLLKTLLDQHGTGRVVFRNTRAAMTDLLDGRPRPPDDSGVHPLVPQVRALVAELDWIDVAAVRAAADGARLVYLGTGRTATLREQRALENADDPAPTTVWKEHISEEEFHGHGRGPGLPVGACRPDAAGAAGPRCRRCGVGGRVADEAEGEPTGRAHHDMAVVGDLHRAQRVGAKGYLATPVDGDLLLRAVRRCRKAAASRTAARNRRIHVREDRRKHLRIHLGFQRPPGPPACSPRRRCRRGRPASRATSRRRRPKRRRRGASAPRCGPWRRRRGKGSIV